jgi:hypothetical protein
MNQLIKLLAFILAFGSNIALAQFTQVQRQEFGPQNLLAPYNPGFENGKARWTNTGATFTTTTTSSNVGFGTTSAVWTPSSTGQTLDSTAVTLPAGMLGANCLASLWYKGGDANTTFEVYDVTSSGIVAGASQVLAAQTNYAPVLIPFICPGTQDSIKLRLTSTASGAAVYLDQAFLGTPMANSVVQASPVVYSQGKTAIVAVGSTGNNQAGHILTATEWPFTTAGKLAYYNFSSSTTTDNSGALSCSSGTVACTLTATGPPTIGSANIFNTASAALTLNGTSQYVSSSDSFFNPGNGKSFDVGGWFAATNWSSGAAHYLLFQGNTSDVAFGIYLNTDNSINFAATNTAASFDTTISIAAPGFSANSFHHFAMVYNYTTTTLYAYIDGKMVGSAIQSNVRAASSANFKIGAQNSQYYFAGAIEDVFFINNTVMTSDDIRKTMALSIAHNKNLPAASQLWSGNWYRSDANIANQLTSSWIVSKTPNTLYADFSDFAAGAFVDYSMQTFGMTATTAQFTGYDSGWLSSTPGTTIAHGLGGAPDTVKVQYQSGALTAGAYQELPSGSYCSYDSTNLYCDWTGLTVSGSAQVRILAWRGNANTVVPAANASTNGLVNTSAQTFGGTKTLSGGVLLPIDTVSSANYAMTNSDGYAEVDVSTGSSQRTITLPNPSQNVGRKITIKKTDSGAGTVLINPYASETIEGASSNTLNAQNSFVRLYTDGTNWFSEGSWDLLSATGAGSPSNGNYVNSASLSLPPGVWSVSGMGEFNQGGTQLGTPGILAVGISTSSSLLDSTSSGGFFATFGVNTIITASNTGRFPVNPRIFSFTSATTVYLVQRIDYGTLNGFAFGAATNMAAIRSK